MYIELSEQDFDPWQRLSAHQKTLAAGSYGATAVFVGNMRDYNVGQYVNEIVLEHYPGMTEKMIERHAAIQVEQCKLNDIFIIHRYGLITKGQAMVVVAAWSDHRADAFSACRHMMNALKTDIPFWKRESNDNNSGWVEKNTDDPL